MWAREVDSLAARVRSAVNRRSDYILELSHLLILGAARSGTTLLATMLARHTEVGMLNEDRGWAMRKMLGRRVVGNKRCIPNQIELTKKSLLHFRFLKNIGIAKEYQSSEYSIEDYLKLPNIRIIGLIRSGNDVISSNMNRNKKSFRVASYRWRRAIEIIYALKKRCPEKVLVVSFENVVTMPKPEMERIAAFLELKYQDRMLEGPYYNPWYAEHGMNTEKVNRTEKEGIDFRLTDRFPSACAKYEELLRDARKPVGREKSVPS
jgi:hypothetical protein